MIIDNIKDISFDNDLVKLIPVDFIEKYNCLPFCNNENNLYILVNPNFNFLNISKLKYYTEKELIFAKVDNTEWSKFYQIFKLNNNRTTAMFKYQIDNNENDNHFSLNESVTEFYDAEVLNSPIVKLVDSIIGEAITLGSSDIHFEPMEKSINVRMRVDGKLIEKSQLPISSMTAISSRIKVMSNLDITKKFAPQDGKLKYNLNDKVYDIRVSILPVVYGERIALRILEMGKNDLQIEDLGLSKIAYDNVQKLAASSSGMILVVGPTGSGKSTTLQTFLRKNLERKENIITVEDPVEYTIDGVSQVQVNEEAGLGFAESLRTILRQDPNIIMIGEIRDLETAQIACRASMTGHLVYSTLHTNNSIGVINRLIDMKIEPFMLVDSLRGIISQRLVRCLCDKCKEKQPISLREAEFLDIGMDNYVYKAKGCAFCHNTGYRGRHGVYEVIIIDEELQKCIGENAPASKYWKIIKKKKMETMLENGRDLVLNGITTVEELETILK